MLLGTFNDKIGKIAAIQVKLSKLEWYYYQKVPLPPPPPVFVYNIELPNTYCHNPGQSKVEFYTLEWYYNQKSTTTSLMCDYNNI